MATFTVAFFTVTILVTASSAAPNEKKPSLKVPDACKGQIFCSIRPEGYDEIEEKINNLLTPFMIASVGDRISPDADERETEPNSCPSDRVKQSPYSVTIGKKTDFLVQSDLLRQEVVTTTCKNAGEPCLQVLGMNEFYKCTCQENVGERSLFVWNKEKETIENVNYTIPVCCSCHITPL